MADQPDLGPTIDTVAAGPQSASSDAGSVTQQPLGALIEADRYRKAGAARAKRTRGVIFSKLIPAGALPDSQGTGMGGVSNPNGFAGGV